MSDSSRTLSTTVSKTSGLREDRELTRRIFRSLANEGIRVARPGGGDVDDLAATFLAANCQGASRQPAVRPAGGEGVGGTDCHGLDLKVSSRHCECFGRCDVVEKKMDMLHCHVSQMYEWLPYNAGEIDQVPETNAERRVWLEHRLERFRGVADTSRDQLIARYGEEKGRKVVHAEAFELSEYGGAPSDERLAELFPF